jgi:hypothetical protein
MADFRTIFDYILFSHVTVGDYRFYRDHPTEEFLSTVIVTAGSRALTLKKDEIVWRAQLGKQEPMDYSILDNPDGSVDDRMKPLSRSAREGRANPKGISVLYVATTPDTAMSEMRPSLVSTLSLAKLKICRDLKLVDCTKDSSHRSPFDYTSLPLPSGSEREEVVWGSINDAFSRPVSESDSLAHYAPTQVLAEYFKKAGYDGIKYRSSYGKTGQNIALFKLDDASVCPGETKLKRVKSIDIEFVEL